MKKPSREELVVRLNALFEDAIDSIGRSEPDGFDLGVVGLVFEVLTEREGSGYLNRTDPGYTPGHHVNPYFTYWCSDHRAWVQEKLFERAFDIARSEDHEDDDENDSDDDA